MPLVVSKLQYGCLLMLMTAAEEEDEWSNRETRTHVEAGA